MDRIPAHVGRAPAELLTPGGHLVAAELHASAPLIRMIDRAHRLGVTVDVTLDDDTATGMLAHRVRFTSADVRFGQTTLLVSYYPPTRPRQRGRHIYFVYGSASQIKPRRVTRPAALSVIEGLSPMPNHNEGNNVRYYANDPQRCCACDNNLPSIPAVHDFCSDNCTRIWHELHVSGWDTETLREAVMSWREYGTDAPVWMQVADTEADAMRALRVAARGHDEVRDTAVTALCRAGWTRASFQAEMIVRLAERDA